MDYYQILFFLFFLKKKKRPRIYFTPRFDSTRYSPSTVPQVQHQIAQKAHVGVLHIDCGENKNRASVGNASELRERPEVVPGPASELKTPQGVMNVSVLGLKGTRYKKNSGKQLKRVWTDPRPPLTPTC